MSTSLQLDRRAFLRGLGGVTLALPVLDAMGTGSGQSDFHAASVRMYTANGMSLPRPEHNIAEWSWFPTAEQNGEFVFGKSTEPLSPFPEKAQLHGRPVSSQRPQERSACLFRHVAHRRSAAESEAGHLQLGRPRPGRGACTPSSTADNLHWCSRLTPARASCRAPAPSPTAWTAGQFRRRTIRVACSTACSAAIARRLNRSGKQLKQRIKLVDAVVESARSLNQKLGQVGPRADGPVPDLAR